MYKTGLTCQGEATSGLTLKRRTTTVGRTDEEKAARKGKKDEGRLWRRARLVKGATCLEVAIIP